MLYGMLRLILPYIFMQKYIFIVGKSDPLGATVQAIRHAGYKVGVFQDISIPVRDTSLFDKVVPSDFNTSNIFDYSAIGDIPIAGLLTSYENYIPAKALIGSKLELPVLSHEAAHRCTDKLRMRQAFATYDPELSPAFQEIQSVDAALDFGSAFGYPVIIKPTNLVKSLLVTRCDDEKQLAHAVQNALSEVAGLYRKYKIYDHQPKLIIEQFMEGDLYSVAAFAGKNDIYFCPGVTALTSAQQIGFDDNFLYRRQLPATISNELEERLFAASRKGMEALGLRSSAAHIELMHTRDDKIKLIEIGARIGGYRPRMYSLSYGSSLYAIEIAAARDAPLPSIANDGSGYTAVYELFPRKAGKFDCLTPGPAVEALRTTAYSFKIKIQRGSSCGPAKEGYKAAAVIIVTSTDFGQFTALCEAVETIEVVLL